MKEGSSLNGVELSVNELLAFFHLTPGPSGICDPAKQKSGTA